jgi:predicted DNA-binding transcriptional regulator YafY
MATNKHAQIRYKILDSCFRNTGRNYTFEDLLDACNTALAEVSPNSNGISIRTLREDIAFMESDAGWSAEIERIKAGRKSYYRYKDSNFSINNQKLNQTELNQINSALEIISRFNGMPQFSWVNEIVTKINNGFELEDNSASIISFDSNQYLKGIEYLGDLFNAINNCKVLKIIYRPFKSDHDIEMIIHPYYLKQYNNRWFLFGLNEKYKTISNIALDRIVSFEINTLKYTKNKTINFSEYFEDIIGVTKDENEELTKIELLFTNSEAPYVLTKPIHESQKKIIHNEDGLLITIEILPNKEFEKLILSFGDNVKVIAPKKIAELFVLKYQSALNLYKIK